ncbi:MAG: proline dehydrogenase family protein, partial [Deltaproteobacteria bacterium]|nr:proline dehydrogenase family protein [Deltaproteobacteria bacterium]
MQGISLQIPKPIALDVSLGAENWKFFLYEEHQKLLPAIQKRLLKYASHPSKKDILIELNIQTVPFLVGLLFQTKEIVIGTARLARELFLLEHCHEGVEALREHVGKLQAIHLEKSPTIIENLTALHNLPDFFNDPALTKICEEARPLENALSQQLAATQPTLFERISDYGLNLTAQYAIFRVHLLKFVAQLPSLDHDKSGREVKRAFREMLRRMLADSKQAKEKRATGVNAPLPLIFSGLFGWLYFSSNFVPSWMVSWKIRFLVQMMAKRFLTGHTPKQTVRTLRALQETGRDATLDQLGELVVSEEEADRYCNHVLQLIQSFAVHIPRSEKNSAGINRAHISIKVSALAPAFDFIPQAFEHSFSKVAPRLKKILLTAKQEDVFINIDAEHIHVRDLVFKIYKKILLETPELKDYAATGIVIQTYLRDAYEHFEEILELARERKIRMPVRLVKGAYWDAETVEAEAHNFDPPQFLNKEETDLHCRQLVIKVLENHEHLQLCLGSHNPADHCFAEIFRQEKFPQAPAIEHQCLHMTFEALSKGMAKMGWAVRNYVTVGSLI